MSKEAAAPTIKVNEPTSTSSLGVGSGAISRSRSLSTRKVSVSGPSPSVTIVREKERSSSLDGAQEEIFKNNNNSLEHSTSPPMFDRKTITIVAPLPMKEKKEKKKDKKLKKDVVKKSEAVAGGIKQRSTTQGVTRSEDAVVPKERAATVAASSHPSILHFSTSSVPTVTHPELPAQLDKFLVTEGMETVEALVNRLRIEDMSDVCSDLSTIFEAHGQTRRLIQWAVRKELANTTLSSESTLFRQTGVATCMVSIECKRKGGEYLAALLRPFVQRICNETKSMEVDPLRLRATATPEDLEGNRRRLIAASQDALELIFASAKSFPESLKQTFLIAHDEIMQKLPSMRWAAISNFYFLRFVAPALVSPKASGLYEGNPPPQALRSLMLISKTLSNAANDIAFGEKEGYMTIMNEVIRNNQPRMREFLESLISVDEAALDSQSIHASFPLQSDLLMARCRLLATLYSQRNEILASLMSVPTPVPGWSPPTRLTSSGNNSGSQPMIKASGEEKKGSKDAMPAVSETTDGEATLGEMLAQLLDAYRIYCPDWVSEEDKKIKKRVQDELMERFQEGLVSIMRPVETVAAPSNSLLRLLLDVEKQRTKELEEELRIIKLKLNTETQAKRDLQLQILRGNLSPTSNGQAPGWVRERQRVASQFGQMYDMLGTFRSRMVELERLVLNEAAAGDGTATRVNSGSDTLATAPLVVSPRADRSSKVKDMKKAQKRRSWNMKLNPLSNNL